MIYKITTALRYWWRFTKTTL